MAQTAVNIVQFLSTYLTLFNITLVSLGVFLQIVCFSSGPAGALDKGPPKIVAQLLYLKWARKYRCHKKFWRLVRTVTLIITRIFTALNAFLLFFECALLLHFFVKAFGKIFGKDLSKLDGYFIGFWKMATSNKVSTTITKLYETFLNDIYRVQDVGIFVIAVKDFAISVVLSICEHVRDWIQTQFSKY